MRKRFTNQFKAEVVLELLRGDKTIGQIASERKVAVSQLSQWRSIALKGLPSLFDDEQRGIYKAQAAYGGEGNRGDPSRAELQSAGRGVCDTSRLARPPLPVAAQTGS